MANSWFYFFSLLLLVFLSSVRFSLSRNLLVPLRRQASVLVSAKQNFEASSRPFLDTWNISNYLSLCSWNGVTCDGNGLIISLDISNLNLSGSFSPAIITQLPDLVNLSVSGNSFSGDFFLDFHKFSRIRFLNISNNVFSGNFTWDFSHLPELEVLDAYNNNFSGPLPVTITDLQSLNYLNLGGNYFSGQIPPSFGGLKGLNFLSLAGNDLSGTIPSEFGNLTNLQWLYLGYFNQFDGGIPPELGKLKNLVHLDLSSCRLEGQIPAELGNLQNLDTLFLQTNQLSGSIPPQLGNLTSLKSLDLSNNGLRGEIPLEFSLLEDLNLLNLFMNKLHGGIPRFVEELPQLQVLKLWRNNFTGTIPSKLGQNGKLIELDLSSNKLTGKVPKTLCFGRRLQILILLNNFLFGPLPDDLGFCNSLSRVRLGQNYFSGSIPKGFLYLPELSLMELQNNDFTGKLDDETVTMTSSSKLEGLNLSNNNLTGILPKSIGSFPSLKILLLSGNRFTGKIPSEIGNLSSILKLDMSRNNFSGNIPSEIGNCLSLTYLDLSQNQLSGPIPVQISQIHILNYFNVSWNHLNQSLPKEMGSMKSLTSADFSHNNFSGSIPENGQFSYFNSTSFLDNPNLCGFYLNPCNNSSGEQLEFSPQSDGKSRVPAKYKLVFALGLLICSLIFAVLAIIKTRNVRKHINTWELTAFQKLEFGSEDIVECLKENNVIGRGGAGVVYKGTMPNGEMVAVKKLGISKGSHHHHDHGLSAEIQTLGRIRHRYIVRLLGFCSNKETNLLIYEYMPNGSLGEVLHGKSGAYLQWDTRLKIAMEAAKGLCYLHHDCSPLIIHRDVKSNNILLSGEFEAHVADFGLAKFLQDNGGTSECMSAIAGSYGYIAPGTFPFFFLTTLLQTKQTLLSISHIFTDIRFHFQTLVMREFFCFIYSSRVSLS